MTEYLSNHKDTKRNLLIILFGFTFFSVSWTIGIENHFIMDDYSTIFLATNNQYGELLSILPQSRYNDRPVAIVLIKVLFDCFGYSELLMHMSFVLIHFICTFLVYKCGCIMFEKKNPLYAILAAGIFSMYPNSLMAVSWIGAVYDLTCCLFVLLAMFFFLKYIDGNKVFIQNGFFFVLFYIVSLRCKEMSLVLPLFFLIYEIMNCLDKGEKIRISFCTFLSTLWMSVYLYILLSFPALGDEYAQSFRPTILLRNFVRYMYLYFDPFSWNMIFTKYSLIGIALMCVFLVFVLWALFCSIKRKQYSLIAWTIGLGIIFAPVLTMENMQHKLYLYIPGIFIGIIIAYALSIIVELKHNNYVGEMVFLSLLIIVLINFFPGPVRHKQWWRMTGEQDQKEIHQIKKLGDLEPDMTVYVSGANQGYNVFHPYGPGHILNLIYNDNTIKTVLVDELPEDPAAPYVHWEYKDGKIEESRRVVKQRIIIHSVYHEILTDGSLNIAVVCRPINDSQIIIVNEKEYFTSIGTEFISANIPQDEWKQQNIIVVEEKEWNVKSDATTLIVE